MEAPTYEDISAHEGVRQRCTLYFCRFSKTSASKAIFRSEWKRKIVEGRRYYNFCLNICLPFCANSALFLWRLKHTLCLDCTYGCSLELFDYLIFYLHLLWPSLWNISSRRRFLPNSPLDGLQIELIPTLCVDRFVTFLLEHLFKISLMSSKTRPTLSLSLWKLVKLLSWLVKENEFLHPLLSHSFRFDRYYMPTYAPLTILFNVMIDSFRVDTLCSTVFSRNYLQFSTAALLVLSPTAAFHRVSFSFFRRPVVV